jgi:tetraacyldisaccharide 4'-kinase
MRAKVLPWIGMPGARWFAEQLERGAWQGNRIACYASAVWEKISDPVRPLELPRAARVIGIGGATLGGSGKSSIALELSRALAKSGCRVAVVASAYPARDRTPRRVRPDDLVADVGDEALWLCRALDSAGVPVFIGAPRQHALTLASNAASLVIVDGLLQARPRRLALSVLALDGRAHWGSERCPPAGDLRALRARLLGACDVVLLATDPAHPTPEGRVQFYGKTTFSWSSELAGAWTADGRFVSLEELRALRLGLLVAVARPERIVSALAARGVALHSVRLCGDHAVPARPRDRRVEAWLTTAKCATKIGSSRRGAPLWTLAHRARLPRAFVGQAAQFALEKPVVWSSP